MKLRVSANCLNGLIDWRGDATPNGAYAMAEPTVVPEAIKPAVAGNAPWVIYTNCPPILGKVTTIFFAESTRSVCLAPFQQQPLSNGDVPCQVSRFSPKRNSFRMVADIVEVHDAV